MLLQFKTGWPFVGKTTEIRDVFLFFSKRFVSWRVSFYGNNKPFYFQTKNAIAAFEERQLKLSLTTAISNGFTLILYVFPLTIKALAQKYASQEAFQVVIWYAAISCNLNPLANIAAVVVRQEDIQSLVRKTLSCIYKQPKITPQTRTITKVKPKISP